MSEIIGALTVWQPWASLIIMGAKPYEFRGHKRCMSYVGKRIVIHASNRKIDRDEVRDLITVLERGGDSALETCLHAELALPVLRDALDLEANTERGRVPLAGHGSLPWGCGLGTARLGEPVLGTRVAEEFGLPRVNDSDRDQHANYGWPMLEVERWPIPVPARGFQGIWRWQGGDAL